MRVELKLFIVLALLLNYFTIGYGRGAQWTDGDTIIVEATREEDVENLILHRSGIDESNVFNLRPKLPKNPDDGTIYYQLGPRKNAKMRRTRRSKSPPITCYSVLGDEGHCSTFKACFPMLYYTEGEHEGQIKHPVLADLLMSTSGPCLPPPFSFRRLRKGRDDFVPFDPSEEQNDDIIDFSLYNTKDLICCPSSKSSPPTPLPDIYFQGPTTPHYSFMRTTTVTTTTKKPKPVKNNTESNIPDAVAALINKVIGFQPNKNGVGRFPTTTIATTTHKTPFNSSGPVGEEETENLVDHHNHEIENIDESPEEGVAAPEKVSSTSTTEKPKIKEESNDASVPVQLIQVRPSGPYKKPTIIVNQKIVQSSTGDNYVPVNVRVPVPITIHEDSFDLGDKDKVNSQKSTTTVKSVEITTKAPSRTSTNKYPEPIVDDEEEALQPVNMITPSQENKYNFSTSTEKVNLVEVTTAKSTPRPQVPISIQNLSKSPCGRINSTSDPQYPWVVAIKLGPKYICAGSLIDEYHIMTAASCVAHLSTVDIGRLRVYLGERILNTNIDGPTIVRKVSRAMRHRAFSISTLRNDIALLKLSLPIPSGTKRVMPVCLPLDTDQNLMLETSSEATIQGWGSSWNNKPHEYTHENKLRVWTNDNCLDKYRHFIPDVHFDDEDMLCGQYEFTSPKTFSDQVETEGSPLVIKDKHGIHQQIGISSWKLGSLPIYPRILTRVSAFRSWVEKNRVRP